jgi:outer membrane protein TolC
MGVRRIGSSAAILAAAALVPSLTGCASYQGTLADREAASILDRKSGEVRRERDAAFVSPRPPAPGEDEAGPGKPERAPPVEVPAILRLEDALRIAVGWNRDYRTRHEGLVLAALSLSGARADFSPRFRSTVSTLLEDAQGRRRGDARSATLGVSDRLPTGGTVDASVEARAGDAGIGPDRYTAGTTGTVTLEQPLLRGAGYEASHEALEAAERQVVYSVRDFARFREQFLVDVTRRFYGLVAQEEVVANTEQRYESIRFQLRRTEAMHAVGRQELLEVLRARNDMLRVENDLVDARQSYALAMDEFRVFLGLPPGTALALASDPPAFVKVEVSLASAVAAALANRFDLANERGALEDAERAERIARRNLLPDLGLTAVASSGAARSPRHASGDLDSGRTSVALTLELPLERTAERNAYRAATLGLDRARRGWEEAKDRVVLEVRDTIRRLRQAEAALRIQEQIIGVEERRLRKAQLDFEAGQIGNRDVLEAEQSLLSARNARVRATVDYEIARIDLERAMGTLDLRDDGGWTARRAPLADAPVPSPAGSPAGPKE